ncbi:hypothetical protein Nepgr_008390 [Nepenthes gracilis]|uniref:Uncharacterized protein n=1 Tax=Nepenthes gracilis TaxID=150966 RepID=A0AAD3S8Z2_NEPGR|nr:hypothetical protein Nepgr_008390 [Nepenthes gracilis]
MMRSEIYVSFPVKQRKEKELAKRMLFDWEDDCTRGRMLKRPTPRLSPVHRTAYPCLKSIENSKQGQKMAVSGGGSLNDALQVAIYRRFWGQRRPTRPVGQRGLHNIRWKPNEEQLSEIFNSPLQPNVGSFSGK